MTAPRPTIAVTGAGGFIGRRLVAHLDAAGFGVRAMVRDPSRFAPPSPAVRVHGLDLPERIDPAALAGADGVVHLAYATRFRRLDEARRVNEEGTRRLHAASREAGVPRFVFVSSLSAHPGARSHYGRSKLLLEGEMDPIRDLVIRLGLVLDRGRHGLFGRIVSLIERLPVIPLPGGGRQPIQTLHREDLCLAVTAALRQGRTGRISLAEPEPLELRALFALVAASLGRRARILPLPAAPVLAGLRAAEGLGLTLPVSSENLLGLLQLRAEPTAADLDSLGVTARSAAASVAALAGG